MWTKSHGIEERRQSSKLLVFCDASFANMTVGGSQGGYIVFWFDAFENSINLIAWRSYRTKGIVNTALAEEALGLIEASENQWNQWNFLKYCYSSHLF